MIPNLIGDGELLLLTTVDKRPDSMTERKYEPKQSVNIHIASLKCNGFSK